MKIAGGFILNLTKVNRYAKMPGLLTMIKKKRFLVCLVPIALFLFVLHFSHLSAADEAEVKAKGTGETPGQCRLFQIQRYLSRFYPNFQPNSPAILPSYTHAPGLKLNLQRFVDRFHPGSAKRRKPRFKRALLQNLGHFAYATASYWIRKDVMMEDWEYLFTWKDQKKRFLFIDGMRFDSNTFQFNWTHNLAGAIYYNYARANHFNKTGSFLFSFGASYFWEFVIEFREVVSINDMISTPVGGMSIGESMFQLGRFFRSRKPTFLNKILRFLSNPVLSLEDWLDKKRVTNLYAFTDDYWYDFRLALGPRFDTLPGWDSNSFLNVGFESQIINIPEYGKPGISNKSIKNTVFTEFDISGTFNKNGLYEYNIFAKTVLFGHFRQNIRTADPAADEDEMGHGFLEDINGSDRVGYSFFLGAASAFELIENNVVMLPDDQDQIPGTGDINALPDRADRYAVLNLLGPTFDLTIFNKNLKLRFAADAYGDFSLIHSHVFKEYKKLATFGQTKATLENHGYYYALGITLSSMLQVNYSNLEFRGKVRYHYFDSIERLDRFQKDILDEDDFDLKDQRLTYNLSLGYRIPRTPLQLVLGLEQRERRGTIGDLSRHSTERRSYFQVKYIFY
jgi:hypothetical protein